MKFTSALLAAVPMVMAAPENEKVTWLPNVGDITGFNLYSGYVNIPGTSKQIHYMFNESKSNPSTDPVLVWTNGGPGCSSMLGWLQEHGPYQMPSGDPDMRFFENQYSWNLEMNTLYIEQPAGVGYSYCEGLQDCSFDDEQSGADNLAAVLAWFEKYPEFKSNELYISGESYGGIYVPYLTYNLVQHAEANAENDDVFKPNIKGFAVGNGVTNWTYDTNAAFVEMSYWHSLIPTELHDKITAAECNYAGPYYTETTAECFGLLDEFESYVSDINIYDIYGTCWGLGLLDWMNLSDTRKALNIPDNVQAWDLCQSGDWWHYVIQPKGSQWIYEELMGKVRMLHFSGDTDGAVPTLGTQNWIATTGWEVDQEWTPYFVDAQVAGYTETYADGGFTFGTVHGAGHMAPQFKPPQTYHLVMNWILGRDI